MALLSYSDLVHQLVTIWKTSTHTHTHTQSYTYTHTHAYTHSYAHTHRATHVHTHTHTQLHTHTEQSRAKWTTTLFVQRRTIIALLSYDVVNREL